MPISSGLNNDRIRVGIILPEDGIRSISVSWDERLSISSNQDLAADISEYQLNTDGTHLRLTGGGFTRVVDQIELSTADAVEDLRPHYGLRIKPVIAGRGFHWEKHIKVDLPGIVQISVENSYIKLINIVDVESYVACVATSEMGSEAPTALLAAQTVVARCWALALAEAKHLDEGFDVCNDDCCQRYQGTSYLTDHALQAAIETKGVVLTYDNAVIDARYSKCCGGMAEDYETVWEGGRVPYLIHFWDGPEQLPGIASDDFESLWKYEEAYCSSRRFESVDLAGMLGKVDVSGSYYRWQENVPKSLILDNLKKYHKQSWKHITGLRIGERGASSRIRYIYLEGLDMQNQPVEQILISEYGVRQMFSRSFLYSSAFIVENMATIEQDDHISLRGVGWGHGVGLCQMGALGMSLTGIDYQSILMHYYPNTKLQSI